MKPLLTLRALALTVVLPFGSLSAQSKGEPATIAPGEAISPDSAQSILEELLKIKEGIQANKLKTRSKAVEVFRKGASSNSAALNLYIDCIKELNFVRNEESTGEFMNWKKRQGDRLKDKAFTTALRLQLQYLVLTIQADETRDLSRVLSPLDSFIATLVQEAEDYTEQQKVLREDVKKSVFAQVYDLDENLSLKEWEYKPLNIAGIYDRAILPHYRKLDKSKIPDVWDRRILQTGRLTQALYEDTQPSRIQDFADIEHPKLKWSKAQDLYTNGYHKSGFGMMLDNIKSYPQHPLAHQWVDKLIGLTKAALEVPEDPSAPQPDIIISE